MALVPKLPQMALVPKLPQVAVMPKLPQMAEMPQELAFVVPFPLATLGAHYTTR